MSGVVVMKILHHTVVPITDAVDKPVPELLADMARLVPRVSPATARTRQDLLTLLHPPVVPRVPKRGREEDSDVVDEEG